MQQNLYFHSCMAVSGYESKATALFALVAYDFTPPILLNVEDISRVHDILPLEFNFFSSRYFICCVLNLFEI